MSNLHHLVVFVRDMDRMLRLFRDILGYSPVWRGAQAGGKKIAEIMGASEMSGEAAFLLGDKGSPAIELIRLSKPEPDKGVGFGDSGSTAISFQVRDLDALHGRLSSEGWTPFTDCRSLRDPSGNPIRLFCIRTEEGLTLEFFEPLAP